MTFRRRMEHTGWEWLCPQVTAATFYFISPRLSGTFSSSGLVKVTVLVGVTPKCGYTQKGTDTHLYALAVRTALGKRWWSGVKIRKSVHGGSPPTQAVGQVRGPT